MQILLTSWASFVHGEATAGDVLAMRRVAHRLDSAAIRYDTCWSPHYRPAGLALDDADPSRYTHLVFVCGPAHGWQVAWLHHRFARCTRIAVGASVTDPSDPAVDGFDVVIPRDGGGQCRVDVAAGAHVSSVPVVGCMYAPGQREYGDRGRHGPVHEALTAELRARDCAMVTIDTRLGIDDAAMFAEPEQFFSVLRRMDVLVSTRLHGLVLGLKAGVPVLAVDPVSGTAKVTAQARALRWPAVIPAATVHEAFPSWWRWCLSPQARCAALACAGEMGSGARESEQGPVDALLEALAS
ncbi:polysaccharide pyruvyl transferase family protein [Tomitella gaofuii]|uniref:polysaccharide pyruvyl transferase family protein n=1 Tax=Tomitella gaofuii TaxID=2760083 RepID=UPI0015FC4DB7|nr:polysaccharide pyruvyl transferase family protein [Tomitella gaofuii]